MILFTRKFLIIQIHILDSFPHFIRTLDVKKLRSAWLVSVSWPFKVVDVQYTPKKEKKKFLLVVVSTILLGLPDSL